MSMQKGSSGSFCQIHRVTDEALIAETAVWPNFSPMNVFFALKGSKLCIIIRKMVQLVLKSGSKAASYGELLNALEDLGVPPAEIEGKVSSTDNTYSVQMRFEDTVEAIVEKGEFYIGGNQFDIMELTEQIVTVRVHWLPLYFDNVILEEIFSEYGQVLGISMTKTAHAKLVAQNGSRKIRLKTDEFK